MKERLLRVIDKAIEVLGPGDAVLWMSEPNAALDNRSRMDVLESGETTDVVLSVLSRIEHGVFG